MENSGFINVLINLFGIPEHYSFDILAYSCIKTCRLSSQLQLGFCMHYAISIVFLHLAMIQSHCTPHKHNEKKTQFCFYYDQNYEICKDLISSQIHHKDQSDTAHFWFSMTLSYWPPIGNLIFACIRISCIYAFSIQFVFSSATWFLHTAGYYVVTLYTE